MSCCSTQPIDPATEKENKRINQILKQDGSKFKSEVRLLLLGAGESGKSTIAKQMKIIHMKGFSDQERASYKPQIYQNVYVGVKAILKFAAEVEIKLSKNSRSISKKFLDPESDYFSGDITKEIAEDIGVLWNDTGFQSSFVRRSEYQLSDSVPYYIERIDVISDENFIPTEQDVLRSRSKTTGIIETPFEVEGTTFRMVDVGGQRSERKKWMHCFQDVTAVIFCVALSEYNLKLEEDQNVNRMHESIELFGQISNSKWFVNTSMILFLNKRDLFEEKLKVVPLSICFPDYKDASVDIGKSYDFITSVFENQNQNQSKQIYTHITCATDTTNVKFVFNAVKDIILHQALDASGLSV